MHVIEAQKEGVDIFFKLMRKLLFFFKFLFLSRINAKKTMPVYIIIKFLKPMVNKTKQPDVGMGRHHREEKRHIIYRIT